MDKLSFSSSITALEIHAGCQTEYIRFSVHLLFTILMLCRYWPWQCLCGRLLQKKVIEHTKVIIGIHIIPGTSLLSHFNLVSSVRKAEAEALGVVISEKK